MKKLPILVLGLTLGLAQAQAIMPIVLAKKAAAGGDITTGLQGWWKFDDNTGTSAVDSSGNSNTGLLQGSVIPTWVAPGHVATSMLNFTGTAYVDIGTEVGLDPTAITMSCWARASSLPNGYQALISAAGTGYHQLFVKSNGKLAVYLNASSSINYDGTGTITLSTGVWYFICVTYDSTNGLVVKVNNVVDKTIAADGALASLGVNTHTSIGTDLGTPSREWNGDIDDARIYDRALTSTDETTLYAYR